MAEFPWVVLLILLPALGSVTSFIAPSAAASIARATMYGAAACVAGLGWQLLDGGIVRHNVGGWGAPLGIDLYVDGLSLWLLGVTAVVGVGVSVHAVAYFDHEQAVRFWPLWLLLLTALNALFVSADIFNLYVTLELMGLAAVGLTALAGGTHALGSAMRYLLAALLGSLAYLLGVALLYHSYGTVDIALLAQRAQATPALWGAAAIMSAGLVLKTALFPLHFWLPPAHASAPAPVSALLSALVVKGSFYILLRLWLDVFVPLAGGGITDLLGLLGVIAILWGSMQALVQSRVKMLVAYSTVAQIGYLFLVFPLASDGRGEVWKAAAYLLMAHAFAKAAMFLAAGNLLRFGGHDRIVDLDRLVQRLPLSMAAFGVAGVSIMGLPPSGGFIGKWMLLQVAIQQARWDLVVVIVAGGLLAAGYVFKVIGYAFSPAFGPVQARDIPHRMEWAAFLLALAAVLLGFLGAALLPLLDIGHPFVNGDLPP